jgi:three-Cys-motif partner protein
VASLVAVVLFCYRLRRMKRTAEHVFGSPATELKLSVVEAYLRAYTKALQGKFPQLWYIDAFAGTGERTEIVPARREGLFRQQAAVITRRGSAKIALDVDPPFDKLIFVEKRRQAVTALCALRDEHPGRAIEVIAGDANVEIPKLIKAVNWQRTRAVMFLDPYGMNVSWETLEAIAKTRAIDVWFLFSLSGLYRQAARSSSAIDETKRAAISRVLGTDAWEQELYAVRQQGFFPDETSESTRTANVGRLQDYVRTRLKTIFPASPAAAATSDSPKAAEVLALFRNLEQRWSRDRTGHANRCSHPQVGHVITQLAAVASAGGLLVCAAPLLEKELSADGLA